VGKLGWNFKEPKSISLLKGSLPSTVPTFFLSVENLVLSVVSLYLMLDTI
jgi:hypothetical protein